MRRQGLIDDWHDRKILAGDHIDHSIDHALDRARIVLIIVSADFLNSRYCQEIELDRALRMHSEGKCTVVPIIARPCDWYSAPFGKLKAVPRDGKAISEWTNRDSAYLDIVKEIRALIESPLKPSSEIPYEQSKSESRNFHLSASIVPKPTSFDFVNSISAPEARRFSDLDKDKFLYESFGSIRMALKEFASAYNELRPESFCRDEDMGPNRICLLFYENGKLFRSGTMFIGDGAFGGGINFVQGRTSASNSVNELLSVDSSEGALMFKPMMSHWTAAERKLFSVEEAAKYLWSICLR
jgi:hypothetical protein